MEMGVTGSAGLQLAIVNFQLSIVNFLPAKDLVHRRRLSDRHRPPFRSRQARVEIEAESLEDGGGDFCGGDGPVARLGAGAVAGADDLAAANPAAAEQNGPDARPAVGAAAGAP